MVKTKYLITSKLKNAKGSMTSRNHILAWTHNFYLFTNGSMKIKTSNTNDNSGLNFGLRFLRNDDSVMQASNIQGESFATYNSCFLRQEKFGTAEVVGKFIIYFASQSFCLKCTNDYDVKERLSCRNSYLQQQMHRQEAKL